MGQKVKKGLSKPTRMASFNEKVLKAKNRNGNFRYKWRKQKEQKIDQICKHVVWVAMANILNFSNDKLLRDLDFIPPFFKVVSYISKTLFCLWIPLDIWSALDS